MEKVLNILKYITFSLLLIIVCLFVFNNTNMVEINLWPFSSVIKIRIFLLIVLSFIFGILFSTFINFINGNFGINKIKNRLYIKNLEKEVNKLKTNNHDEKNKISVNNN